MKTESRNLSVLSAGSLLLMGSLALAWLAAFSAASAQPPLENLKDFRIDKLVRFRTPEQADLTREQLIRAIWPEGLPSTQPTSREIANTAPELAALEPSLIASARHLDVDISGFDWHAHVYVVLPKPSPDAGHRLAIVHGGHMPEGPAHYLDAGLSETANQLLRDGYVVALIQMPLVAWNRDADGLVEGRQLSIERRGTAGHNELFAKIEPQLKAGTLRFFLEPIVQTINQLLAEFPESKQLLMIGLSGGGWTTHLYAAVDTRVNVSLPVAGALPLYARPFSPGSKGDAEQEYAPIFAEADTDQDGIPDAAVGTASWLEVFALGAISRADQPPRKQVQVLNLYDTCCFHGEVYKSYAPPLRELTSQIRSGDWSVFVDETHRGHLISPHVLEQVLSKVTELK